jgi:hypothetical protein
MRHFGPDLERRRDLRHRPNAACEIFLGAQRHEATIVDYSHGGVFVQTDAPVWPAALVRVRLKGAERFALVVHQRHIPVRLRKLVPGGVGLRWVRAAAAH